MIDTVDFLRRLTQVIADRMGDVETATFSDNWPDDDEAIRLDLTDGQQLVISVETTR